LGRSTASTTYSATGRAPARRQPRNTRKRRALRIWLWPAAKTRQRWQRTFQRLTPTTQICVSIVVLFAASFVINWVYQVVRKPSELLFPVSGVLYKTPAETWDAYAPIFKRHSTAVVTPELLAALAQVEGSGNPVVRTYWRWSLTTEPFEMYRPASSAVGMYQITDGTFAEARRYCVRDHRVVEDGPWNDYRSCWFNTLYSRLIPTHAVEMTAAYLDRRIDAIVSRYRATSATLQQKQNLAAVIHLCGAGAGEIYAKRRFQLSSGQRCGDHLAGEYLARVSRMKRLFVALSLGE